jgi:hypothetical protein
MYRYARSKRLATSGLHPRELRLQTAAAVEQSWFIPRPIGNWQSPAESFKRRAIRLSGYVVHTLEAADRSNSFEEAVLLAANLGDDAVTRQIAGALHGLSDIPQRGENAWHGMTGLR